ncbi:MAG: peptidase M19 [Chloroflexi bacterium]|nr:MAG: peptidase M19 [Chloroflexota bacterium]
MFIVDAHLDIAYNALSYGRNPLLPLDQIRAQEKPDFHRGTATVTIPELQKGNVGLVFGSLFVAPATPQAIAWNEQLMYHNPDEAHRYAMQQLDLYHRLADEHENICLVTTRTDLERVLSSHQKQAEEEEKPEKSTPLLGIVPLMEGADPIRVPEELEAWYEYGLRIIGLAWDDTRYAAGAWRNHSAGITKEGYRLLEVMAELGVILDVTHMSETAVLQALDAYEGPIVATHCNPRALIPTPRHLTDLQIRRLAERDGVIGIVLYNVFLRPHHRKGEPKEHVTLDHIVAHIDHICQLLGDATHVGIGSDFDGGFGAEDIPAEMDSIADLKLIANRLQTLGYEPQHIANIMGENWIRILRNALPT